MFLGIEIANMQSDFLEMQSYSKAISKVKYGNSRNVRWHSIILQRTEVLDTIALRTACPI
jgi:hypothetical protein